MKDAENNNLELVRMYLAVLGNGEVGDRLASFFSEDAVQVEFPNRLNPNGQESDLATIIARSIQGKHLLTSQEYEIISEVSQGNRVAVEAKWTGVLAMSVGGLSEGAEMNAHFAMFFEFADGVIVKQHNYDCFEPW